MAQRVFRASARGQRISEPLTTHCPEAVMCTFPTHRALRDWVLACLMVGDFISLPFAERSIKMRTPLVLGMLRSLRMLKGYSQ